MQMGSPFKAALLGMGLPVAGGGLAYVLIRSLGLGWFSVAFGLSAGAFLWSILWYFIPPSETRPFKRFLLTNLAIAALCFLFLATYLSATGNAPLSALRFVLP